MLAEPPGLTALFGTAGIGLVCWLLAPAAAVLIVRGQPLGAALAGTVGFVVALLSVADVLTFHRAVVAFGGPFDLDRLATVITFGGGLGLFLAAVPALRGTEAAAVSEPVPVRG